MRHWTFEAAQARDSGESVTIHPTGTSMSGIIEPGQQVTLIPAKEAILQIGDVVLTEIQGKRRTILVLHRIWNVVQDQFLIGNAHGRMDGWVSRNSIKGVAVLNM